MPARRAAVIGAGIAGLAAADALAERGWAVDVFEASDPVGGRIGSRVVDGCLLESGPDGFFAGTAPIERLIGRLGLDREVIEPLAGWAGLARGGRIVPMPTHLWNGIPYVTREILATPALGPLERLRLLAEPLVPANRMRRGAGRGAGLRGAGAPGDVNGVAESLDELLVRRIGRGAARHLVGPLLAGVHAGRADELDAASVAPPLVATEQRSGSWLRAARRSAVGRGVAGRPLRSLAAGMGTLTEALAANLLSRGVAIDLATPVTSVTRDGRAWCVEPAGRERVVEGVVLAVPPPQVARLLGQVAPDVAAAAGRVALTDAVLAHLRTEEPLPPAYASLHGAIVPPEVSGTASAITVVSAKWHGRAPAGVTTIRASARPGAPPESVAADVAALLALRTVPSVIAVDTQAAAFPVMRLGHAATVRDFRAALARSRGIEVVGGAWDGVGLGALVLAAEAAAARLDRS